MSTPRLRNHWRAEVSASVGVPSAPVFLPMRLGSTTVKVMPGAGGTAEMQFTLDDPNDVQENPGAAKWLVWDPGPVAADTVRAMVSVVSALRLVAYSQPATGQVVVSFDY